MTHHRTLGWILACAAAGLGTDLLLSEHHEDRLQWIPLVLLALLLPARAVLGTGRGWTLRLWQGLMLLFGASGVLGVVLHVKGKMEFVLERTPEQRGLALLLASLEGAAPPVLAPGAMVLLGALGLLWSAARPPRA